MVYGPNMERRRFIVGAAIAASAPLAVACSRADSGNANQFQSLPASDKRVGDFMRFYTEFWTDPTKAVNSYTSPDVVYTSTSGKDFNQAALTGRLTDWAQGLELSTFWPNRPSPRIANHPCSNYCAHSASA